MKPPAVLPLIPSLPWRCLFTTVTGEIDQCDLTQDETFAMKWEIISTETPTAGTGPDPANRGDREINRVFM